MSALAITIAALKASPAVVDLVGTAINPIAEPPFAATASQRPPSIVVNLLHDDDESMLAGPACFYEGRVTIECRAATGGAATTLGQAVVSSLRMMLRRSLGGFTATFIKEGTDVTGYRDDVAVYQRTVDFYVRWR